MRDTGEDTMLYDSHAHLNNEDYTAEERQTLIDEVDEAVKAGKMSLVNDIGFDLASSKMAVDHAATYPWCYAVVGYHPHNAKDMTDTELTMIGGLTKKTKVQAIGEIGLDFHYDYSPRDEQRDCFRKQIALANDLKMPIVIHSREADGEVMEILKQEGAFSDERKSRFDERTVPEGWESAAGDARVLIHCYSGSRELAEQYVRLGATISMAGPLTYKNNRRTVEACEFIPIDFLLVETDSPYLAPEPMRGKINKPIYVTHTARRMAVIKGMTYEEVAARTCKNAKIFFNVR